jgi:ATP-binding cassette, subfamily B, bacterial HlyB/CyaB
MEQSLETRNAPFGGGLLALSMVAARHGVAANPQKLMHQLALGQLQLKAEDIVKAAGLIGLKARIIHHPNKPRLKGLPTLAILKLKNNTWESWPRKFEQ